MVCAAVSVVDSAGLATAVEQAADGVAITNTNGIIQYVNPAFTALTGYTSEEAIGQNPRVLKSGLHPLEFYQSLWQTISSGKVWQGEMTNRRKDGTLYEEEMRIAPVCDASGAITGYIAIKHDITERRSRESAQAFLASIVEHSDAAIITTSPEGIVRTWNRGAERLIGISAEQAIGQDPSSFIPPHILPQLKQAIEYVSSGHSILNIEGRCLHADGHKVPILVTGSPVRDASGKVVAATAIIRDITERKRTERALLDNQAHLREIFQHAPVGMYVAGSDGRILQANATICQLLGYSEEELLAKTWLEISTDEDRETVQKQREQLWSGTADHIDSERDYFHHDGHSICCHVRISILRDEKGIARHSIVHVTDISERKRADAALQEAANRLSMATQAGGVGIWEFDVANNHLIWDEQMFRIYGVSRDHFVGAYQTWYTGLHPEDRERSAEQFQAALRGEKDFDTEFRVVWPDQSIHYIRALAQVKRDAGGKASLAVGTNWEITAQKQAEMHLRESEERFRSMADGCPSMLWVTNAEGNIQYLNRACREYRGVSDEEMTVDQWRSRIHPDDIERYAAAATLAVTQRSTFRAEYRVRRADGQWRMIGSSAEPRFSPDGQYLGHIGLSADITERKQAEIALIQARERAEQATRQLAAQHKVLDRERSILRTFLDHVPNLMFIKDTQSRFVIANPATAQWSGLESADQLIGKNDFDFFPPDVAQRFFDDEQLLLSTGQPLIDHEEVSSDVTTGETRYALTTKIPLFDSRGVVTGLAGIATNITQRKRIEVELIHAREAAEAANRLLATQHEALDRERIILRTFIDNVPDLMFVKDTKSRFLIANVATAKWNGKNSSDDLIGKTDYDCFSKEVADVFYESEQRLMRDKKPLLDQERSTRDNESGELRYVLSSKVPLFDNEGRVIGLAGIARNITERKKNEDTLQRSNLELQAATERAKELAVAAEAANLAKSRFLANMSHEIRTPMNGVIGMGQLLLQTDLTDEQRRYAEVAQASGRTLLTLIDQILDLSKIEAGKLTLEDRPFNLAHTLDDVVQLLRNQAIAKAVEVKPYVSSNIPPMLCGDAHRLRQILTNLISNGIKFTSQGSVAVDVELFKQNDRVSTLRFTITDTGIGLRQDQIDLLFSPFVQADVSTTRRFGGSGLGLAICKQLVEMMGGCIGVDSIVGQGSTFWFTAVFQHVAQTAQPSTIQTTAAVLGMPHPSQSNRDGVVQPAAQSSAPTVLRTGRGQRILVAEDNPTNREVVLAQLRKLGYKAEAFADGEQAVEALQRGGFDLVLMDCAMPVMDGYQATHQIRRSGLSDLPIIALTASAMASDRQLCLHAGMNDYLAKPVELTQLAEALDRWLPAPVAKQTPLPAADSTSTQIPLPTDLFDAASLMRRLMDDRELAGIILQGFLQDAPAQIELLRLRLDRSDISGTHAQAHALKGAAATVAAEAMRAVALEIEQATNANDLDRCRQLLPRLVDQFQLFKTTIEQGGWVQQSANHPQVLEKTG